MKYSHLKRILDVVLTGTALVLLGPLLLIIAIVLKFTGERRVFYHQERIGQGGRAFNLIKFTTMMDSVNNRPDGGMALDSDPEVFPFGRFLRRTKLNELPQLLNVIWGDMALVGPRPLTWKTFSKYPTDLQAQIGSVRPGLTGVGSVVFRSEEALLAQAGQGKAAFYDEVVVPHKGRIESWYVRNMSLALDLKILVATALVVLSPRNTFSSQIVPFDLQVLGGSTGHAPDFATKDKP